MKLGVNLYSVRKFLQNEEDTRRTFAKLREIGYEVVQLSGAAPMPAETVRKISRESGLPIVCTHSPLDRILHDTDALIREHRLFGCPVIGLGYLPGEYRSTEALRGLLEALREPVKKIEAAGMRFAYHNHAFEFQKIEDQVMLEYMIRHTDPENVLFEMDVYWVVIGQNSPVDYFNKYPGRFTMLHIKDHREIGQSGMVGYDAIFKNTDTAGVRHIVAEIEKYSCPVEESVKQSLDYLLDAPFVKASYSK